MVSAQIKSLKPHPRGDVNKNRMRHLMTDKIMAEFLLTAVIALPIPAFDA
jgi:hypothetical protein